MAYKTSIYQGNQHMYDTFVRNSKNGTIFHEMNFLSYHQDRFDTIYLMTKKGNSPMAVCAGVIQEDEDGKGFIAHKGSTYGGPVIKNGGGYSYGNKIFDSIIEYLTDNEFDYWQFRLAPSHLCETQAEEVEFEALQRGGKLLPPELTTFVQLRDDIDSMDQLLDQFSSRARRAYRKADDTGIEVKWDDPDLASYHEILSETLDERYEAEPTHTLEELELLKRKYPNRIFLTTAYHNNKMIAGSLIMLLNTVSAHAFYFATRQDSYQLGGLNKVIPDAILTLHQDHQIYNFNFGISSGKYGKTPNSGLFKFKEGFHNRNILRKTFKLHFS